MIKLDQVFFSYTKESFIEEISFEVKKGEIFGFLGPSGAGKSTLQKIMIGLLTNYSGSVTVDGVEIRNCTKNYYETIGIDFEFSSLYEKMTARENLSFFASLYQGEKRDIDELMKSVELLKDADKKVSDFSKGMKSRLNFIKALIHDPEILFLDEPTNGLDPNNCRIMKDMILNEKQKGKTIIITTHDMVDATELCDRVAFIINGKVKAIDTPHNLIMKKGAGIIEYSYMEEGKEITVNCNLKETKNDKKLKQKIEENSIMTIHSSEPNLGDIFMDITGRQLV